MCSATKCSRLQNEETEVKVKSATQGQTVWYPELFNPRGNILTCTSQYLPENMLWSRMGTSFEGFGTFVWIELWIYCHFTGGPLGIFIIENSLKEESSYYFPGGKSLLLAPTPIQTLGFSPSWTVLCFHTSMSYVIKAKEESQYVSCG